MHIIDVIREQEANDAFLLREEFGTMANFVKIGRRVVNLDNVTEMAYVKNSGDSNDLPYVRIDFANSDNYAVIDKDREPEAFSQLMTWMDERPALLSEE